MPVHYGIKWIKRSACSEYQDTCIMVVTETWLQPDIPDVYCTLRCTVLCLCLLTEIWTGQELPVGLVWSNHQRETISDKDVELLCVSLRPFYLPLEFGSVGICAACVLPDGNTA